MDANELNLLKAENKQLKAELKAAEKTIDEMEEEYRLVAGQNKELRKQNKYLQEKVNSISDASLQLLYAMGIRERFNLN